MWRRKLRTTLTIFGIVIGIFAFTVMGSMAEKINLLISGAAGFYGSAINVQGKGGGSFGGAFTTDVVEKLRRYPGVADVQPSVITLLRTSTEGGGFSFGPPNLLAGVEISDSYLHRFNEQGLKIAQGENLAPGDTGVVVVGADIADEFDLSVGATFHIRGEEFRVKGILQRSLQFADKITTCPLEDARRIYTKDIPLLATKDIVTSAQVYAASGIDADELALHITDDLPEVRAVPPSELKRQFEAGAVIFNLIVFGVALIAVIVGGLSVINTMIMSVSERTREIGIKRAVGAKTKNIIAEYLGEASLIGLFGGLIGFGLGWITTLIINAQTRASGTILFTMTWRLALGALLFSMGLGVIAGLYPAFRAARMDPVKALRTM